MRTDIHAPSKINPSEYEFVACEYVKADGDLGAALMLREERKRMEAHMRATGGKMSGHEHGGVCHVCGSVNAIYTVRFYHRPTNTYISVGQDCAQKLDRGASEGQISAFRRNVQNYLEARAGKNKARLMLADAGLAECWNLYLAEYDTLLTDVNGVRDVPYEERTIRDIVGGLVRYGSLSEKQIDFLRKLWNQIVNRAKIEGDRKAECESAQDCPEGRQTITGTVLSVKTVETSYGDCEKSLIRDDRGFKVYGSVTAGWGKGDRVTFTATIQPSQDDKKFGFYKRPTKAKILTSAE